MKYKAIISGLAGALALTAAHEGVKVLFKKNAPKVDMLGQKSITKLFRKTGLGAPRKSVSYITSLAGDLLINTVYYSLATITKQPMVTGTLLGTNAASGTIALPSLLNFGKKFIARNTTQKVLAYIIYLSGGLAAAGTYKALEK